MKTTACYVCARQLVLSPEGLFPDHGPMPGRACSGSGMRGAPRDPEVVHPEARSAVTMAAEHVFAARNAQSIASLYGGLTPEEHRTLAKLLSDAQDVLTVAHERHERADQAKPVALEEPKAGDYVVSARGRASSFIADKERAFALARELAQEIGAARVDRIVEKGNGDLDSETVRTFTHVPDVRA